MKKPLVVLLFIVFFHIVCSQSIDKIVGEYKLESGSHDPQGGVTLLLTPKNQYVIAYFGGVKVGTWKECDGNLIMQPDTTFRDMFYISGRNNPQIAIDSIYISFSGLDQSMVLCSFNSGGKSSTMHPVFNQAANCVGDSRIGFKKGEYDTFSLMSAPTIFSDMEYDTEALEWADALRNYLKEKNKSIEDTDTITGIKYTFPLSPLYNEYDLTLNPSGDQLIFPSLGVFRNSKLYSGSSVFRKTGDINSLSDGDKRFISELSTMIAQRPGLESREEEKMSRSQMIELGMSEELISEYESEYQLRLELRYKPVFHIEKQKLQVNYDLNNMLTSTCYEYYKNRR